MTTGFKKNRNRYLKKLMEQYFKIAGKNLFKKVIEIKEEYDLTPKKEENLEKDTTFSDTTTQPDIQPDINPNIQSFIDSQPKAEDTFLDTDVYLNVDYDKIAWKNPKNHEGVSNIIPDEYKIENIKNITDLEEAYKNTLESSHVKGSEYKKNGYTQERKKYLNNLFNKYKKLGAKFTVKYEPNDEDIKPYLKQFGSGINVYSRSGSINVKT